MSDIEDGDQLYSIEMRPDYILKAATRRLPSGDFMPTKPTGLGIGILTPRIETDCRYGNDSRPALQLRRRRRK